MGLKSFFTWIFSGAKQEYVTMKGKLSPLPIAEKHLHIPGNVKDMSEIKPTEIEIKTMSAKGIAFLINEEGMVLKPYLDSVGIATIGVGCTYYENGIRVKMTDKHITKERAIQLFSNLLKTYEMAIWSNTRDDINQNQFDAMCSLCFNIGVNGFKNSTVLKRVNANPVDKRIGEAFEMWRKPIALLGRRRREVRLYFS